MCSLTICHPFKDLLPWWFDSRY